MRAAHTVPSEGQWYLKLDVPYNFILKVLRARLLDRSIESRAKFVAQAGDLLLNHNQQLLLKLLVPPMVTAMMAALTHPLAPICRQMHHPHHFDAAIAAVQWF